MENKSENIRLKLRSVELKTMIVNESKRVSLLMGINTSPSDGSVEPVKQTMNLHMRGCLENTRLALPFPIQTLCKTCDTASGLNK